jgi:hypothetical protein
MNCNREENQLIDYLLNNLTDRERNKLEVHLSDCSICRQELEDYKQTRKVLEKWEPVVPPADFKKITQKVMTNVRAQRLIEKSSQTALSTIIASEKKKVSSPMLITCRDAVGRMVKQRSVIATAMAAMIIIVFMLGINLFTRQSTESIAWADMIEKIEKIGLYKFQLKTSVIGAYEEAVIAKAEIYHSSEYGILSNRFFPGMASISSLPEDYSIIEYGSSSDNTFITAYPEIGKYTRLILPEKNIYRLQEFDLVPYLKMLSTFNHKKLENKIIDGKEVVGFEIIDPKFGKEWSDITMAQIWIDRETTLPVLYEFMGTGVDNIFMGRTVLDKFEWYETDDTGIFEPDFSEYQLVAEIEVGPINEETVILTLQRFSEVAKGRYPEVLAHPNSIRELKLIYKRRTGGKHFYWEEEDFEWEDYTFLFSHLLATGRFYGVLFIKYEDVAYHGKVVTANDLELPLLRWKISDDDYRVLFGDLRIENVSAADLAELEADLKKSKLFDPPTSEF